MDGEYSYTRDIITNGLWTTNVFLHYAIYLHFNLTHLSHISFCSPKRRYGLVEKMYFSYYLASVYEDERVD